MSLEFHLKKALFFLKRAEEFGLEGNLSGKVESLLYQKRTNYKNWVVYMPRLRKDTIIAVLASVGLTRFPDNKVLVDILGLALTSILAYAHRIPVIRNVDPIVRLGIRYNYIWRTLITVFIILTVIDIITGNKLGFGGIRAIGEKYGFAFASEGFAGVFKQIKADVEAALEGVKKQFGIAPPKPQESSEVILVESPPPKEEKLKETEEQIIIPESL